MSPNIIEWSHTNSIQMAVQAADLSILNNTKSEKLILSCTLLTIARGKCNVEISQQNKMVDKPPNHNIENCFEGSVIIPRDRPVMKCEGSMPKHAFRALYEKFVSTQSVGRPILFTIFLNEKLSVSVKGDLFIEDTRKINVDHIDIIFPLR